MIMRIVLAIVVLIAVLCSFAAMKPKTFRIQRSIAIKAPPETVFALINDIHNWPRWAPQDKQDPSLRRSYSGAACGKGAVSDWEGNGNSGKGRMTITRSDSPSNISVQVDFIKPFEAHNRNEFTLDSDGVTTKVTWTMEGTNLYVMRLMSIFVNMDKKMGKHFERGLESLRSVAEQ